MKEIDAEGFFLGTVLHSLDHSQMDRVLTDPLSLAATSRDFESMASLGRFVRVGFVSDIPALQFNNRFSDAPRASYKTIYERAKEIDVDFADRMHACISQ